MDIQVCLVSDQKKAEALLGVRPDWGAVEKAYMAAGFTKDDAIQQALFGSHTALGRLGQRQRRSNTMASKISDWLEDRDAIVDAGYETDNRFSHTPVMTDHVNNPPHYTAGTIECIEAIRAALGKDGFYSLLPWQFVQISV